MKGHHIHKLNTSDICCADHAYEMCKIFSNQKKEEEAMEVLLNFGESVDTSFLLDTSAYSSKIKVALASLANKFALQRAAEGEFSLARNLLQSSEQFLNGVSDEQGFGLLASTNTNLAYVAHLEGDLEEACRYMETGQKIEMKIRDIVGGIITKINKSALLVNLGAFHEAYHLSKESAKLLEPQLEEFIRTSVDQELLKTPKFVEFLELYIVSYINQVTALENMGDRKYLKEAREARQHALKLATRFFPGHNLTMRLSSASFNPKKDVRVRQNVISHYSSINSIQDLDYSQGKISSVNRISPITGTEFNDIADIEQEIQPAPVLQAKESVFTVTEKVSPKEEIIKFDEPPSRGPSFGVPQIPKTEHIPSNIRKIPISVAPKRETGKIAKVNQERPELRTVNTQEEPTEKKKSFSTGPSFGAREFPEPQFYFQQKTSEVNLPVKFIRMPSSPLPQIPPRACWNRDRIPYDLAFSNLKTSPSTVLEVYSEIFEQEAIWVGVPMNFGSSEFLIVCSILEYEGSAHIHITTAGLENPEWIELSEFHKILHYLGFKDLLPSNMHLKYLSSFEKFSSIFILPFLRVITDNRGKPEKIELWAQAGNLLSQEVTRVFLRTNCKISVVYIEKFTFRVILFNTRDEEDYEEKCLRFDIVFDSIASAQMAEFLPETFKEGAKVLPAVRDLKQEFIYCLEPVLNELELYIKDQKGVDINFDDFVSQDPFLMVRSTVTGEDLNKTLWIVEDMWPQRHWEIRAKNLPRSDSTRGRSTYAPKAKYTYMQILQNFGLRIDKLDYFDRRVLAHFVLESMRLDSHTDQIEDFDCEDVLMVRPLTVVMNKRFLASIHPNDYKVPVDISLIATPHTVIGLKSTFYNLEKSLEEGCLATLDGSFHLREGREPRKAKHAMSKIEMKVFEETRLPEILNEEKGWHKILSALEFDEDELFFNDLLGSKAYIESFENIINRYN